MSPDPVAEVGPDPLDYQVYRLLSDRAFRSGSDLARACGVSRSAIWKAIARLRALGVTVDAVPNRGYRLPAATPLLQADALVGALDPATAERLRDGECHWCVDSTNTQLGRRPAPAPGQFDFMTAEYQSAGRGRRARRWFAPPGGSVCLSLSWAFAALPADVGALSLVIGVCALRVLDPLAHGRIALKWPNDLVVGTAKLGGILTELRAEAGGPALVIVGIGLNVSLGPRLRVQVEASGTQPADLVGLAAAGDPADCPDRNALTAALVDSCVAGLQQFGYSGFKSFIADWRAADALAGKEVVVSGDGIITPGHARGIDAGGALCVQTRDGLQRFLSGEVSVRSAS